MYTKCVDCREGVSIHCAKPVLIDTDSVAILAQAILIGAALLHPARYLAFTMVATRATITICRPDGSKVYINDAKLAAEYLRAMAPCESVGPKAEDSVAIQVPKVIANRAKAAIGGLHQHWESFQELKEDVHSAGLAATAAGAGKAAKGVLITANVAKHSGMYSLDDEEFSTLLPNDIRQLQPARRRRYQQKCSSEVVPPTSCTPAFLLQRY